MREAESRTDVILVDPPRCGLDATTRELVALYEHVLYISCNPKALLTDLAPRTIDNLQHNLALNGLQHQARGAVLDWREPSTWPSPHDVVIGADLVYASEAVAPLASKPAKRRSSREAAFPDPRRQARSRRRAAGGSREAFLDTGMMIYYVGFGCGLI